MGTSGWGTPLGLGLPDADRPPGANAPDGWVRTHKIVDGDTLGSVAERYLGSADRRLEIYEANRDVLPSPQVLPIGVELRIPPRRERGGSATAAGTSDPTVDFMPKRPLVPISEGPGEEGT